MKITIGTEVFYIGILNQFDSSCGYGRIEAFDLDQSQKSDRYLVCVVSPERFPEKENLKEKEIVLFQIDNNDRAINVKHIFNNDYFIFEAIINQISLNYAGGNCNNWYTRPILTDRFCLQLLSNPNIDIFPYIANRLIAIGPSVNNINMIVFLTELMAINKPDDFEYYEHRDWEKKFIDNLTKLKNKISDNQLLDIILWASHHKTKASFAALREYFSFFPPYLQIKCVRKIFQLVSNGKLRYTNADGLYMLLSIDGTRKICLPLEITFEYLKRREKDTSASLDNNIMYQILDGRDDHKDWQEIRLLVNQCKGRWYVKDLPNDHTNPRLNSFFNGFIELGQNNKVLVSVPYKMIDSYKSIQKYNNKYFKSVQEFIKITYQDEDYMVNETSEGIEYFFDISHKVDLFVIARTFNLYCNNLDNYHAFETTYADYLICECRTSDKLDNLYDFAFNWCGNRPCFSPLARFHIDSEWEQYTVLDFMRILNIPTDFNNRSGKVIRFGHYIVFSSFLRSFTKFYEHLICRKCGCLLKPAVISNFANRAVTEYSCNNDICEEKGNIVYLNHCFNKLSCDSIIDSRDSKTCPNGQYICSICGACCSTENYKLRLENLKITGGVISNRIRKFVNEGQGHWEREEFFCYKCGNKLINKKCESCNVEY